MQKKIKQQKPQDLNSDKQAKRRRTSAASPSYDSLRSSSSLSGATDGISMLIEATSQILLPKTPIKNEAASSKAQSINNFEHDNLKQRIKDLKKIEQELTLQLDESKKNIGTLEITNEKLIKNITGLEKINSELSDKNEKNKDVILKTRENNHALKSKNTELFNSLRSEKIKSSEINLEYKNLKAEFTRQLKENETLLKEKKDLERSNSDIKSFHQKAIDHFKQKLSVETEARQKLAADLKKAQAEFDKTQASQRNIVDRVQTLEKSNSALLEEKQDLTMRLEQSKYENRELFSLLIGEEFKNRSLRQKINDLNTTVRNLEAQNNELHQSINSRQPMLFSRTYVHDVTNTLQTIAFPATLPSPSHRWQNFNNGR